MIGATVGNTNAGAKRFFRTHPDAGASQFRDIPAGYSAVVLGAVVQTDTQLGLANNFLSPLVTGDMIFYQTTVGGTITVNTAGEVSAGVGYVANTFINAIGYHNGVQQTLQFTLNDDGLIVLTGGTVFPADSRSGALRLALNLSI